MSDAADDARDTEEFWEQLKIMGSVKRLALIAILIFSRYLAFNITNQLSGLREHRRSGLVLVKKVNRSCPCWVG